MVQAAHTTDLRVQQEVASPESSTRASFRVLQLLPEAREPEGRYACDGGGNHGLVVGFERVALGVMFFRKKGSFL